MTAFRRQSSHQAKQDSQVFVPVRSLALAGFVAGILLLLLVAGWLSQVM